MALQLERSNEIANATIREVRLGRNNILTYSKGYGKGLLLCFRLQLIEVDNPWEAMVRQPSSATGRVRFGADDR